jgi:hypothetical protein
LERKLCLMEDNMPHNIDSTYGNMKAFIANVRFAISQEYTRQRSKRHFVSVIRSKIWPTFTSKHFEKIKIWNFIEK